MPRILILDDMQARHEVIARRYPDAERVHVYTSDEAVLALATGRFDLMLLDHDLGEERNGYHVALEIAALPVERRPIDAIIHSHNPVGAERMRVVLVEAGIRARLEPFSSHIGTESGPPTERDPIERLRALVDACRALPEGLSLESLIANLRAAGASKAESIYALHRLRGVGLTEAKSAIDRSETWIDRREADAGRHDELLEGAEELLVRSVRKD